MLRDSSLLPAEDEGDEDLARAYIAFEHADEKSSGHSALFWSWERMSYLAERLPQRAWDAMLLVLSIHPCPRIIGELSWPLTTVLVNHASRVLPLVEAEAQRNPALRELLACVPDSRLSTDLWLRIQAAIEQTPWDGTTEIATRSEIDQRMYADLMPRDDENPEDLARAWIALQTASSKSDEYNDLFWAFERMNYLTEYVPHKAWRVILLVWSIDQSIRTMQNLSAGPIEDLLAQNGGEMIPLVQAEARRDPTFAKLLGGVWKNRMTDEVWERLQAVWDRRGWDGIPE